MREASGGGCKEPHAWAVGVHYRQGAVERPESGGGEMRGNLPLRRPRSPEDEVFEVSPQADEH